MAKRYQICAGSPDAGDGEVRQIGPLFRGKAEAGTNLAGPLCQIGQCIGGFNSDEQCARLVRVWKPTEAADGCADRARAGNFSQGELQFLQAVFLPRADELCGDVKIGEGAPGYGSLRTQMFENQLEVATDGIFDGKAGEEP